VAVNGGTQRTPYLVFLPFQRKGRAFPRGLPQGFLVGFEENPAMPVGAGKEEGRGRSRKGRGKVEERSERPP